MDDIRLAFTLTKLTLQLKLVKRDTLKIPKTMHAHFFPSLLQVSSRYKPHFWHELQFSEIIFQFAISPTIALIRNGQRAKTNKSTWPFILLLYR